MLKLISPLRISNFVGKNGDKKFSVNKFEHLNQVEKFSQKTDQNWTRRQRKHESSNRHKNKNESTVKNFFLSQAYTALSTSSVKYSRTEYF